MSGQPCSSSPPCPSQAQPLQPRQGQPVQQPGPHPTCSPPSAGHLFGELPARRGCRHRPCQPGVQCLPALWGGCWLLRPSERGSGGSFALGSSLGLLGTALPLCGAWGALSFVTLSTGTCCPQVVLLGDCVGGILGFDALCQSRAGSGGSRSSSRRGSLVSASAPTLGLGRVEGGLCPWVMGCRVGGGAGGS